VDTVGVFSKTLRATKRELKSWIDAVSARQGTTDTHMKRMWSRENVNKAARSLC
jgi:hypothetical protein